MRNTMFSLLAVLTTAALLGCGGDSSGPGPGPNGNGNGNGDGNGDPDVGGGLIEMRDNFFNPEVDTVEVGTNVRWENRGGETHTTTSDDGLWDETVPVNDAFTRTFDDVGEFTYYCAIHAGMDGTLVVLEEY